MSNERRKKNAHNGGEKKYTKDDVRTFLTDIEQQLINSKSASLHSLVAVNQLLRLPEAPELFDEELKGQLRDIWIKLRSSGVQLADPPCLFGLPKDFGKEEEEENGPAKA